MARERTKFVGVYQRQHSTRRHLGKPDVCFDITYKTADGKKVFEKIGWISEGYTAQMASQVRSERIRTMRHSDIPTVARKKGMTFAQGFERYKQDWLSRVKTAAEDIRRYNAYLSPSLADMPLSAISALELDRLQSSLAAKGYSPQTIKHALGLVRRVYRKLVAWGVYGGSVPTDNISMPRVDASRTRFLSRDEASKLLDALRLRSPTWHDIALMSLNTGMRLGEILALCWEDVDLINQHVHVRDAKAGSRTAMLTDEAAAMLAGRVPLPTGLVFPARGDVQKASFKASKTFFNVVEELGFNTGITDRRQRVVFHTLRHTFASWLALEGVPLYVIGELLGHKTLEMTKRYSHLCPDAKRAAIQLISASHACASCKK